MDRISTIEPSCQGRNRTTLRTSRFIRGLQSAVAASMLLITVPLLAPAQTEMACGSAVSQLQAYVQQVNAIAQMEHNRGIPAQCGYNAYCAQTLLQQLRAWYAQRSMLVNQWYGTIARQCSPAPVQRRSAGRKRQADATEEIEDVDDLKVDDEDKTVKIKIPSKPSGFRN